MSNGLRTKISELPLCEDISLIDTLLGIGADGVTYRVDAKNLPTNNADNNTKNTYVFNTSSYTPSSSDYISISIYGEDELTNLFVEAFHTGGLLVQFCLTTDHSDCVPVHVSCLLAEHTTSISYVSGYISGSTHALVPYNLDGAIMDCCVYFSYANYEYEDSVYPMSIDSSVSISISCSTYQAGTNIPNTDIEYYSSNKVFITPIISVANPMPPEE